MSKAVGVAFAQPGGEAATGVVQEVVASVVDIVPRMVAAAAEAMRWAVASEVGVVLRMAVAAAGTMLWAVVAARGVVPRAVAAAGMVVPLAAAVVAAEVLVPGGLGCGHRTWVRTNPAGGIKWESCYTRTISTACRCPTLRQLSIGYTTF